MPNPIREHQNLPRRPKHIAGNPTTRTTFWKFTAKHGHPASLLRILSEAQDAGARLVKFDAAGKFGSSHFEGTWFRGTIPLSIPYDERKPFVDGPFQNYSAKHTTSVKTKPNTVLGWRKHPLSAFRPLKALMDKYPRDFDSLELPFTTVPHPPEFKRHEVRIESVTTKPRHYSPSAGEYFFVRDNPAAPAPSQDERKEGSTLPSEMKQPFLATSTHPNRVECVDMAGKKGYFGWGSLFEPAHHLAPFGLRPGSWSYDVRQRKFVFTLALPSGATSLDQIVSDTITEDRDATAEKLRESMIKVQMEKWGYADALLTPKSQPQSSLINETVIGGIDPAKPGTDKTVLSEVSVSSSSKVAPTWTSARTIDTTSAPAPMKPTIGESFNAAAAVNPYVLSPLPLPQRTVAQCPINDPKCPNCTPPAVAQPSIMVDPKQNLWPVGTVAYNTYDKKYYRVVLHYSNTTGTGTVTDKLKRTVLVCIQDAAVRQIIDTLEPHKFMQPRYDMKAEFAERFLGWVPVLGERFYAVDTEHASKSVEFTCSGYMMEVSDQGSADKVLKMRRTRGGTDIGAVRNSTVQLDFYSYHRFVRAQ